MNQPSNRSAEEVGIHDPTGGSHPAPSRRSDTANAFLPDPFDLSPSVGVPDDAEDPAAGLAEELGEEYVTAITTNIDIGEQELALEYITEMGGPFTFSSEREEVAVDEDSSNPPEATREPFPAPMRST